MTSSEAPNHLLYKLLIHTIFYDHNKLKDAEVIQEQNSSRPNSQVI